MLKLKNIKKNYKIGNSYFPALKGVSLSFRDNEFVSILGASGSGKTTLLNIIGGLDHYSAGDLIIDGVSTKKFSDRDWDNYRNHKIGFIFQSYNLIPHQTVLQNVELALTISGISKAEKVRRATEALNKVGLGDMIHKKPNQLSGGQCQRVAIARALVNEPSILLADEPTGALDSVTSVQIMELIKEIAQDRLVIMVTHNPELAEQYSTRIVKLSDGLVIEDNNPYTAEEEEPKKVAGNKKAKLSVWSAFRLSAQNLRSKWKRTLMISLAGSIGIIGVAAVLAVSSGVNGYIVSMQDDMLSGNPIAVAEEGMDLSAVLSNMSTMDQVKTVASSIEDGKINVNAQIEQLVKNSQSVSSYQISNTITQDYIDFLDDMPEENYAAMQKYYGIDATNNLFTDMEFTDTEEDKVKDGPYSLSAIKNICVSILKQVDQVAQYADMVNSLTATFGQTLSNSEYVLNQYDVISTKPYGEDRYPTEENEIMVVLNSNDQLTDILLAELGYFSQDEFTDLVHHYVNVADDDPSNDDEYQNLKKSFTFEEILGKEFTYYPNNDVYGDRYWAGSGSSSTCIGTYNYYEDPLWNDGMKMKITTILSPKENTSYGCLSSGFYFTEAFTKKFIQDGLNSDLVKEMKARDIEKISSGSYMGSTFGISYSYNFYFDGGFHKDTAYVGTGSALGSILSSYFQASSAYSLTLRDLGGESLPSRVAIYPTDFANKFKVTDYLDLWNGEENITLTSGKVIKAEDRAEITYTDNLSVIIAMIGTVIDVVTYALVAFTALSLVVSTVMISIITLVSVLERIKEIGVIRSLGGRKRDVANLFLAETFMIGFFSGVLGIGITYLIQLLINVIVGSLSGIYTLAALPVGSAITMIIISVALTGVSGIVPAMSAARKDPVVALRTE